MLRPWASVALFSAKYLPRLSWCRSRANKEQYECDATAKQDGNREISHADQTRRKGPEPSEVVEDHREDHCGQSLDRELRHREIRCAEEQKRQRNTVTSDAKRQDGSNGGARSNSRNRAQRLSSAPLPLRPGALRQAAGSGGSPRQTSAAIVSDAAVKISTST